MATSKNCFFSCTELVEVSLNFSRLGVIKALLRQAQHIAQTLCRHPLARSKSLWRFAAFLIYRSPKKI
jgi:hypothetical protein